jgi:hypothetical protein
VGHAPEQAYRALMQAHAELGNRSGVVLAYQQCCRALFSDLGVEPSSQTQRLFYRLRAAEADSLKADDNESEARADDEGPAPGTPPFRGLHYFDVGDADLFFGREPLTATLVRRVRTERFLAVIGASGSGKSGWCARAWSPLSVGKMLSPVARHLLMIGRAGTCTCSR